MKTHVPQTSGSYAPGVGLTPGAAMSKSRHDETSFRFHPGPLRRLETKLLERLLQELNSPPIQIHLWNGARVKGSGDKSLQSVYIHDRATLWRILLDPWLAFPSGYVDGRITVDGGLDALLTTVYRAATGAKLTLDLSNRLLQRVRLLWRSSAAKAPENIHHHYDLGNDFYQLWLDERLVYTCAYFASPHMSLEAAQLAKLDYVCRKLRLQPGMTVLEAGCGWGALALYMASRYGVRVRAFNLSTEQIAFARERARQEGVSARVEFIQDDWRAMVGPCDVFVSVGMLEHVGPKSYTELGQVMKSCLREGGIGLLHFIGKNSVAPLGKWIERFIFPGAYVPALSEAMTVFETQELTLLDVENLRPHYARTLEYWLDRFESQSLTIQRMFDERFVRAWRMYLAGSVACFRNGDLQLFQVLFTNGTVHGLPWTREYLYEGAAGNPPASTAISANRRFASPVCLPVSGAESWKPLTH